MNKKDIKIISLLLISALSIIGCGNSNDAGDKKEATALHMTPDEPEPVNHIGKHIKVYQSNDFDPDGIEWEYDNHEGMKIHTDDSTLYIDFTYDKKVPNIQFFIDTDNDTATGNLSEGGAEYMIENGYLYKSLDPKEWKWKEIAKLKSTSVLDKRESVAIELSDIDNLSVIFSVNAQALDENWKPLVKSPIDGSKSIYSEKNAIEWDSIKPYATSLQKVVKLFDTDKMIYLHLEQDKRTEHIQIYIDSDDDPSTGYKSSAWENFGRDYLIEDGSMYEYTGKGDWGWKKVAGVERTRKEEKKEILDIAIPKNRFKSLAPQISIGVETNDKSWTDTSFVPEGSISKYTLSKQNRDTKIRINEVLAANTKTAYDPDYFNFNDFIELYNPSDTDIDISGYYLSDKLNEAGWKFPSPTILKAHDYLVVWADGKDKAKKALHTDFKLKAEGEAVALFDRDKKLIHGFEYLKQLPDISVTEKDDGLYYMTPTAGFANGSLKKSALRAKKPLFSLSEGFYDQAKTLTITADEKSTIHYTTDGSAPDENSAIYDKPLTIDKTVSVRAIAVSDGKFQSPTVTKSYIIDENIDIPVVSIAIDEKYLYDDTIGIYTKGSNGKEITDCGEENIPQRANYAQKWERPAHMTLFDNDSAVLSQDIGIKIAGECSRVYPQKSFQLKADDKYGKDKFSYHLFKDKPIKKFKRLKLRNAGQDYIKTHLRDALQQYIAKDELNVSYEAYRPVILFINGDFRGLYSLREKIGKDYIKENFSQKKINLLEDDRIVKEGSSKEFDDLVDFLNDNSLSEDENYDFVASQIDIDNYIDYMITNIYFANGDWPGTNLIYWKSRKNPAKWRWILHDMDFGMGRYSEYGYDYDALGAAMATDGGDWPNPPWSTLLFRKLLENESFKERFKERFLSKLDTAFAPRRIESFIDSFSSKISPYIQRHIQRWRIDGRYSYAVDSKEEWQKEIEKLKDFADSRADTVKEHIRTHLK